MRKKYNVYLGMVDYTIHLDAAGKLIGLSIEAENFARTSMNQNDLITVLEYMFVGNQADFKELYKIWQQQDAEMFKVARAIVKSMVEFCESLKQGE